MKILLTGSSGFIGKNIYEGLHDKYTILAPSHRRLDIMDYRKVEDYINKNRIDTVIHSAIEKSDDIAAAALSMFVGIIRNSGRFSKIIHIGSGAEYDKMRGLVKIKEDEWGKKVPQDRYGAAKYLCSDIARNNEKVVTLRLFGVYGKYEDYRYRFISNTIAKVLCGLPIAIKQDVIFDYLYIDDFIPVIDNFLKNKAPHHDYNVTPDLSIKLSQIARLIKEVSGKNFTITIKNKGLNFQYTGDNKRLKKDMPGLKFTSYREGIARLYKYYLTNMHLLDKKALLKDEYFKNAKIR